MRGVTYKNLYLLPCWANHRTSSFRSRRYITSRRLWPTQIVLYCVNRLSSSHEPIRESIPTWVHQAYSSAANITCRIRRPAIHVHLFTTTTRERHNGKHHRLPNRRTRYQIVVASSLSTCHVPNQSQRTLYFYYAIQLHKEWAAIQKTYGSYV